MVHRLLPHVNVEGDGLVHGGVVDEAELVLALAHRHKTELLVCLLGGGVDVVASRSLHLSFQKVGEEGNEVKTVSHGWAYGLKDVYSSE